MAKMSLKKIFILFVAVIGAVFLNKYAMKDSLVSSPKFFVNTGSYLFAKIENFGGFVAKIENFNHLADGNDKLKQDQKLIVSLQAKIDNLENENNFLRQAARISQKLNYTIVDAGIFNFNLAATGYNALLNKGFQEGISEGDIVVTKEGILVGKIQKVMQNFSRVLFVSDLEFKVTVKVMNSNTFTANNGIPSSAVTGIAEGALNEGMYLDFIVQADDIKEQDLLISTGNDQFPPALIVGSVDLVEVNETQMFKKVRIRPAVKDAQLGKVLVIKIK